MDVTRERILSAFCDGPIQMLPSRLVKFSWVLLVFTSISSCVLPWGVEGQSPYSSNPDDYDFGWLANGTYAPGSVPVCTYCVNAFDPDYNVSAADEAKGPYWNRTVGLYRCDGVQINEKWAYHEPSRTIVFANLTTVYCIDAVLWDSIGLLKLRPCNSSVVTQQWRKEGNRVISGLQGSNGEPLFLVGELPDKGTNPSVVTNSFSLTLNSSLASGSGSGSSYTTNFTFLSTANIVDQSTNRFTTEGLLRVADSSLDKIVNGGFESSTIQAGTDISWSTWVQNVPSYFSLCGWVIDYGPIDYVGLLRAEEGSYSVHLNTHSDTDHWGSISQTFRTEVGNEYDLSFYLNGFPPQLRIESRPNWKCSATYKYARLQVRVTNATSDDKVSGAVSDGTGLQQNFTFDATNSNAINVGMLWQLQTVKFRASTNVTMISFISLNFNDSCGPMIDAVKVSPFQRPGLSRGKTALMWGLIGSIGGTAVLLASVLAGYLCSRKYYQADEDYSALYKTENARVFSVKELSFATNKFGAVLGEGAFGTVYKADFPDGTAGAVKVEKMKGLNSSSKVLASDEIAVLLRVHHRNLVNLTGYCISKGRHMLVFEYLPNGSLYDRLHQSILNPPSGQAGFAMDSIDLSQWYSSVLPWQKRVKIASDVAYGLEYLHHDANPPIVHRDVKSQNILLTATDSAKLADFGLSKAAPTDATAFQSIETMVRGSIGYLDPQYFLTGVFSPKSDVYSYGVVLLELISGHQAIYNASSLASWAAPYMTGPSLYHELVDKKLNGKFDANELQSLVELSSMCMQEDSRMRPNMRQVVAFLNSRGLVIVGSESSEVVEEPTLKDAYEKMQPLFIEFQSVPEDSATGSSDNFALSMSSPKPRD